ncbi:MAG: radical SAM protein [Candidatus Cloacimonas sp.]|nr:radical SAM protein [Candidatus Cloacimonas sp.]
MANIAITSICNRSCSYCFAKTDISTKELPKYMSSDIFHRAVDLLLASGQKEIRIIGGEPFLHPQIHEFIDVVLKRQGTAMVFSNGLISEDNTTWLSSLSTQNLSFLANLSPLDSYSSSQKILLERFLELCGDKIALSFNIFRPGMDCNYLIDYIVKFNLKRTIRIGIAHPNPAYSNSFLLPKHYKEVGQSIKEFEDRAKSSEIELVYDCGFVPCMFPGLASSSAAPFPTANCSPILDILTDGSVICCFPLARIYKTDIYQYASLAEMHLYFSDVLSKFDSVGIFKACNLCSFSQNYSCKGGCISHKIRRFRVLQTAKP